MQAGPQKGYWWSTYREDDFARCTAALFIAEIGEEEFLRLGDDT